MPAKRNSFTSERDPFVLSLRKYYSFVLLRSCCTPWSYCNLDDRPGIIRVAGVTLARTLEASNLLRGRVEIGKLSARLASTALADEDGWPFCCMLDL